MKIQLLRNATLLIESQCSFFMVDPMLSVKGELGRFPYLSDERLNPLVDLPLNEEELKKIIASLDFILLSHLHPDHWDKRAIELLNKDILILCQPSDKEEIMKQGFNNIQVIHNYIEINNLKINRVNAKHGEGEIGNLMGQASGFIIDDGYEKVYIVGDSIWCDDVISTIDVYEPDKIIINGGGAMFDFGKHVTMNSQDILRLFYYYPNAKYTIVHLDAVSPTKESREYLKLSFKGHLLDSNIHIPEDGELC